MFGSVFSVSWDDGKTAATVKKLQSEEESETVVGEDRKILIDSVNYYLDRYLAEVFVVAGP
jgi:hypothetical protein